MSSSLNVTLFGDASPVQIAIWVCGVVLVTLLGGIIAKSRNSQDLRFLTCCVLVSVFAILGFAYVSSDDDFDSSRRSSKPAATNKAEAPVTIGGNTPSPITNPAPKNDRYLSTALDEPQPNANSQLQLPNAKSSGRDGR